MRKKNSASDQIKSVQKWFATNVTYDGEPYVLDTEQVAAVINDSKNTIVVARAGSGKTRTLVAKVIYLVAKRDVQPSNILAFVFNANAAAEINQRLSEMLVDGKSVIPVGTKIAYTFHAFSRKIVYDIAGGKTKCGDILAGEKDAFVYQIVQILLKNPGWQAKIRRFILGDEPNDGESSTSSTPPAKPASTSPPPPPKPLTPDDITKFASMMSQFINRAQQKFLGGPTTLPQKLSDYLSHHSPDPREQLFLELGAECYRRYHWHLLGPGKAKSATSSPSYQIPHFSSFGTDFNLLVSWASQIIRSGRPETNALLLSKKYLLIDEYQDFSQLFLSAVQAIRGVATSAKLFVVGDDWQAINRFAGSDVDYFQHFETYFPDDTTRLEISTNYRCHYQIVDTARKFMAKSMHEKGHFKAFSKQSGQVILVNPKTTPLGFALVAYDTRISPADHLYKKITDRMHTKLSKKSTVQYIKTILQIIAENPKAKDIMILHRNNETKLQDISLEKMQTALAWGAKQLRFPDTENFASRVQIMTMHRSKGLEADVVILLEADDGIIPRVHPDTSLYEFFGETTDVVLADQKRLFYVAMTRAKKRLYIIHTPAKNKKDDGFIPYLGKNLDKWRED